MAVKLKLTSLEQDTHYEIIQSEFKTYLHAVFCLTLGILTPRFDKSQKYVIDIIKKRNQGEQNG